MEQAELAAVRTPLATGVQPPATHACVTIFVCVHACNGPRHPRCMRAFMPPSPRLLDAFARPPAPPRAPLPARCRRPT